MKIKKLVYKTIVNNDELIKEDELITSFEFDKNQYIVYTDADLTNNLNNIDKTVAMKFAKIEKKIDNNECHLIDFKATEKSKVLQLSAWIAKGQVGEKPFDFNYVNINDISKDGKVLVEDQENIPKEKVAIIKYLLVMQNIYNKFFSKIEVKEEMDSINKVSIKPTEIEVVKEVDEISKFKESILNSIEEKFSQFEDQSQNKSDEKLARIEEQYAALYNKYNELEGQAKETSNLSIGTITKLNTKVDKQTLIIKDQNEVIADKDSEIANLKKNLGQQKDINSQFNSQLDIARKMAEEAINQNNIINQDEVTNEAQKTY